MLMVLADYADDQGSAYPSVATLARKCRMQPRNANYILKALQDSGELVVLKNQGPRGTNRYRIMLAQLGVSRSLQAIAPLQSTAPLQPIASTPALHCAKPLHPIADEPSSKRQEPSPATSALGVFDQFYQAYPRKVGKKKAAKSFTKEKAGMVLPAILADINGRLSTGEWSTGDKMQFIPYPSTYLNDRRWEDQDGISGIGSKFDGGILPGAI
jgi:hypothetical protein